MRLPPPTLHYQVLAPILRVPRPDRHDATGRVHGAEVDRGLGDSAVQLDPLHVAGRDGVDVEAGDVDAVDVVGRSAVGATAHRHAPQLEPPAVAAAVADRDAGQRSHDVAQQHRAAGD